MQIPVTCTLVTRCLSTLSLGAEGIPQLTLLSESGLAIKGIILLHVCIKQKQYNEWRKQVLSKRRLKLIPAQPILPLYILGVPVTMQP